MIIEPLSVSSLLSTHVVQCAADKSITHRAIIFAACARGESVIVNPSQGDDCLATLQVFKQLGVQVRVETGRIKVTSLGKNSFTSPQKKINFQNSGTTARLLIGLLSSLPGLVCACVGDKSLTTRPMGRVINRLREVGADIQGDNHLPLLIRGKRLLSRNFKLDIASAQVKGALLLATMNMRGIVKIDMPAGTRQHTESMLQKQGIDCAWTVEGDRQKIAVTAPYELTPQVWKIPADPSATAFFVALGVLMPAGGQVVIMNVLADTNRLAFLDVIIAMGGQVEKKITVSDYCEEVCELTVHGGKSLRGVSVNANKTMAIIDEVVILAVLALFADGETTFRAVGELRYKESDRLDKITELITKAGGKSKIEGNTLYIQGIAGSEARPFIFNPAGDHRLAMAATVCGLLASRRCVLEDESCVKVSFPHFFQELDKIRGKVA